MINLFFLAVPFVDLNDLEAGKPKLDPTFNYYGIYEDVTIGKEVYRRYLSYFEFLTSLSR